VIPGAVKGIPFAAASSVNLIVDYPDLFLLLLPAFASFKCRQQNCNYNGGWILAFITDCKHDPAVPIPARAIPHCSAAIAFRLDRGFEPA